MSGYGILDGTNSGVASDLFMRNVDYFDFPMESLEGDDLNGGYWDAKLQSLVPILSEVLAGSSLPSGSYIGSAASVVAPSLSYPSKEPEPKCVPNSVEEAAREGISHQNNYSGDPVLVHGSQSSCSSEKRLPSSCEIFSCSKRSRFSTTYLHRSSASKELRLSSLFSEFNPPKTKTNSVRRLKKKKKKKKKLAELSGATQRMQRFVESKKCLHCQVSETPQWRDGPMGRNTLCNACGVRYRSGRLFAEYCPAASPTFVPSLHSNIHKQVIDMRENVHDLVPTLVGSSLASGGNAASVVDEESSEVKPKPNVVEENSRSSSSPDNNYSIGLDSGVLQTPSPFLAHQSSSSSCSSETCVSLTSGMVTRSMRSQLSTTNPHRFEEVSRSKGVSESNLMYTRESPVKRKLKLHYKLPQQSGATETRKCSHCETNNTPQWRNGPTGHSTTNPHRFEELSRSNGVSESNLMNTKENPVKRKLKLQFKLPQQADATETRKCSHCESKRTPQWRNGPMGPKTLCNACGVRYRQGRLFPEYRPAGSPAFVPSLHSSSHKVVVQMRERAIQEAETEPPTSLLPKLEASEQ